MSVLLNLKVGFGTGDDEPYDYLLHYAGDIIHADNEERVIGSASAYVVLADLAENSNQSLFDVLDSEGSTAPYMVLISREEAGNLSPAALKILKEEFVSSRNFLIIDRLEILPAYRGRKYGLQAMRAMTRCLGTGCRFVALKPFPLQFEAGRKRNHEWLQSMEMAAFEQKERPATSKLIQYYGRLGFRRVPRTPLMILDLYDENLPTLEPVDEDSDVE